MPHGAVHSLQSVHDFLGNSAQGFIAAAIQIAQNAQARRGGSAKKCIAFHKDNAFAPPGCRDCRRNASRAAADNGHIVCFAD